MLLLIHRYVIWENLQHFLDQTEKDSRHLLYVGRKFTHALKRGFNSGGAGYLIKKEAVGSILEERRKNSTKCPVHSHAQKRS